MLFFVAERTLYKNIDIVISTSSSLLLLLIITTPYSV